MKTLANKVADLEEMERKLVIAWGIITKLPDPSLMQKIMVAWEVK